MKNPLLTIAIPTYNRSHLLLQLLEAIIIQIASLEEKLDVEIVVSDNCSTDNTNENIDRVIFQHPNILIRKNTNSINVGPNNNILKLGYELALGDFCWIIGDDDLIRDGAIKKILEVIKSNLDIQTIYINQSYEKNNVREDTFLDRIASLDLLVDDLREHNFENAQEILYGARHSALFTSVSSLVFKTSYWRKNFIGYQETKLFTTVENTFPHSVLLADALMNLPVYYLGYPYLRFFVGEQDWLSDWKYLNFIQSIALSDVFKQKGANKKFLKEYRKKIWHVSFDAYLRLKLEKDNKYRICFKELRYFLKYFHDKDFLKLSLRVNLVYIKRLFKKFWKNQVRS